MILADLVSIFESHGPALVLLVIETKRTHISVCATVLTLQSNISSSPSKKQHFKLKEMTLV